MVELKKGLNYIIGDKAYTPEQLLNLLRRACLVLFFVGLPVAFAGGIAFSKIFLPIFEPRPFVVMQQTDDEDAFILSKSTVSHEYVKQACSTYLLDSYQTNSRNPDTKLIPKVTGVDGFAFSQKDIWCAAQMHITPLRRSEALEAAEKIAANGWRVWVEHKESSKRIFESEIEKVHSNK